MGYFLGIHLEQTFAPIGKVNVLKMGEEVKNSNLALLIHLITMRQEDKSLVILVGNCRSRASPPSGNYWWI